MFDWIGEFVKELFNLIPKLVYLLYTSLISLVDLFQLLFRKLAGLDVYYVDGVPIGGDLVTNFIQGILGIRVGYGGSDYVDNIDYSALSTVFWAFVIFGLVICFVSTLIAIIKSHYSYNEKSVKGPLPIVATAGKAVINMVAVPIIIVLGLWLSQAILTALDDITSTGSSDIVALYGADKEELLKPVQYKQNNETYETYIYYDMFGFTGSIFYNSLAESVYSDETLARVAARSQTFSGSMFKVAAYNANRIRTKEYVNEDTNTVNEYVTGFGGGIIGGRGALSLFENYDQNTNDPIENAATMVDTAFANFLHLDHMYLLHYFSIVAGSGEGAESVAKNLLSVERYFCNLTTLQVSSFSKFNVGLVWYYYNLWSFNFIVGFGSIIVCIVIFINVILGLMTRFFMCLVLFFVMPPLAGLMPLDGGKAFGTWRESFMRQVLMAYGAVVGMNLILILLPFVNQIDFFNIKIADLIVQTFFIIVGLITIKTAISVLSGIIGAEDANKAGDAINKEVGGVAAKAFSKTVGAFGAAGKLVLAAPKQAIKNQLNKTPEGKAFMEGAKNASRKASAFLKGGRAGYEAEKSKIEAEKSLKQDQKILEGQQEDLDEAQKGTIESNKAKLLQKINGKNLSNDDVRNMAHADGLSDKETESMIRHLQRDRRGQIMAKGSADKLAASGEDEGFKKFYDDHGGNMAKMYATADANNAALKTARDNVNATRDRMAKTVENHRVASENQADAYKIGSYPTSIFSATTNFAKQFMGNFSAGLSQSEGANEFMKGITQGLKDVVGDKGGPSDAEQTAKNTAALGEKFDKLDKTLLELTNELRQDRNKKL